MIPNIHIHEQLMFERHKERQRQMAQHRQLRILVLPQLKELPRHRSSVARHFVAGVGTLFLALRTRLRKLESSEKKVEYEHSSV